MKVKLFLKVIFLFLLLLVLQYTMVMSAFKILNINREYSQEIIFLCIDLSHVIIIFIMIIIWKLDVLKLFKKIKVTHILLLMITGILIALIYPIANIPNLINYTTSGKSGMMTLIDNVLNQEGIGIYYLMRTIILMPFLEEILYRGIIQNKLSEKISIKWAILFSSVLFAIGHLDFQQSITVFFSSLLIGYIYYRSNNLTVVVLLHCFVNVGFSFFRIEYQQGVNYKILLYHFILIVILIFIAKLYPKNYTHGN